MTLGGLGRRRDRASPPPPVAQIESVPRPPLEPISQAAPITSPVDAGGLDAPGPADTAPPVRLTNRPAMPDPPPRSEVAGRSAQAIAELYVAVGQALKALADDRGPGATEDLWPLYRRIRIHDAIVEPANRDETEALLLHLRDQIVERDHR